LSRDDAVNQAFKDCMKTRNYTWASTKLVQNPPSRQNKASGQDDNGFIDPDTGLMCHNTGFASICEPPAANLTIHYTDKHGLNCTRTGGLAICSSL
jgi:hypothetical protein